MTLSATADFEVSPLSPVHMVREVDPGGSDLCLAPRGRLYPEFILENLGRVLAGEQKTFQLRLDLGGVERLDHMSLSALIVVLRTNCRRYKRIELRGLPCWARARLCLTKGDCLLGKDWDEQHGGDWVVFIHRNRTERTGTDPMQSLKEIGRCW